MANQCCQGALLQCSFGVVPSGLNVLPNTVATITPAGNILDNKAFVNVLPFGMCSSPMNPGVVAAMGAPVPCTPQIITPWLPGVPNVMLNNLPALNNSCKCMCAFAGMVSVTFPGEIFTQVG